jgi:hypothetical protein
VETLTEPTSETSVASEASAIQNAGVGKTEIRFKGQPVLVPSVSIDGRTVISTGGWLKTATVVDEDLIEGSTVDDPESFVRQLKKSGLRADLFTFAQRLPEATPRFGYHIEWENVAAIPIVSYAEWWEKRTDPGTRRAVRKAAKVGVEVKVVEFDDALVEGIVRINNETPIRQGKPFWHYQKSFESVKLENSTYADRNVFLGAYWQGELIGYMRMTYVGIFLSVIQVLSMMMHYEKKPANALIAKAVEVCEQKRMSHLMYCNYVYNDPHSSLTEFKRRNGFEKVLLPRYYVPLSAAGSVALRMGLHLGFKQLIPKPLLLRLLRLRSQWYDRARTGDRAGSSGKSAGSECQGSSE